MTGDLTPQQRSERARIASNERWSRAGAREAQSATLRASLRARLEQQVDPDGVMTPDELEQAVRNANRARMAKVRARRAAKAAAQPIRSRS